MIKNNILFSISFILTLSLCGCIAVDKTPKYVKEQMEIEREAKLDTYYNTLPPEEKWKYIQREKWKYVQNHSKDKDVKEQIRTERENRCNTYYKTLSPKEKKKYIPKYPQDLFLRSIFLKGY